MTERLSAIVLAAGQGSRMRSTLPKPLHRICGRPMVLHTNETVGLPTASLVSAFDSPIAQRFARIAAPHEHEGTQSDDQTNESAEGNIASNGCRLDRGRWVSRGNHAIGRLDR